MRCYECGALLHKDNNVCNNCGKEQIIAVPMEQSYNQIQPESIHTETIVYVDDEISENTVIDNNSQKGKDKKLSRKSYIIRLIFLILWINIISRIFYWLIASYGVVGFILGLIVLVLYFILIIDSLDNIFFGLAKIIVFLLLSPAIYAIFYYLYRLGGFIGICIAGMFATVYLTPPIKEIASMIRNKKKRLEFS